MACRICTRCGAIVIEGGGTLAAEQGELRRHLRRRVVLLCVGCQESFLDWLLEVHEVENVLSPMPSMSGV